MKTTIKIFSILFIGLGLTSCNKENEVPPRTDAVIREYTLPQPTFLTNEERDVVIKEREEYDKL